MRHSSLYVILVLLLSAMALQGAHKERRRGKYLRMEPVQVEAKDDFVCTLQNGRGPFLRLAFRKVVNKTIHEVRIYEVLMEIVHENQGEGVTERGNVEYLLVPNETIRGEESIREETQDAGPLVNCNLRLNGVDVVTGEDGVYVDSDQRILGLFDNLATMHVSLLIEHARMGSKSLELTRNLIRRDVVDTPGVAKKATTDILQALEMNFTQQRSATVDGMKVSMSYPKEAKAGQTIPVTVEVTNLGRLSSSNLIARSFSSETGLNGKMFYFGTIIPGGKQSFSRLLTIPAEAEGNLYFSVNFWSILGAVPMLEQRGTVTVVKD